MGANANPEIALGPVQDMETAATDLINTRFDSASESSQTAMDTSMELLNQMAQIEQIQSTVFTPQLDFPSFPSINVNIQSPNITPFTQYSSPSGGSQQNITLDTGNAPTFDIAKLELVIPDLPDLIFPVLSGDAPVVNDIALPNAPSISLPDVPILQTVTFPDPISLNLPTFSGVLPVDNIVLPTVSIDPGILNYDSPILEMFKSKVLAWITTSGTGLDPIIEQAIYDRNYERDRLQIEDTKQKSADEWSKRGFVLPNGVLATMFQEQEITFLNKRTDTSRDIAIAQAKLAQENTHFYIQKALELEVQLMNWTNLIGQRTFEASKASMDAAIHITQLAISKYNVSLESYKTQAQVYETLIRSELAKVELYKAQLDASRTMAEVNKISVDIYRERVDALNLIINIYLAQIKAAMAPLDVSKAKIDAFIASVQAYSSQINAIVAKYNAYNSLIQGEKAKVDVYKAQVDAFTSQTTSYKIEADVQIERARVIVEQNRNSIAKYSADVEAAKAVVIASSEHAKATSEAYQANIMAQRASSEAQSAQAQAIIKSGEIKIQAVLQSAESTRRAQDANVKNLIAVQELRSKAILGAAQVAAQIASGAMAGVSVSAALHAQASASQSFSGGESITESHSYTNE